MKKIALQSTNYERRIWIELIGFDNTRADCGAAQYLDNLGFVPDAISYLITSPDIIHLHQGLEVETEFPANYCSYCGHERNSERERQVWTNYQLKTLTEALQARGIKVFLATFASFFDNTFNREWLGEHPELLETRRTGETHVALLALKRLADGQLYEDFFVPQLARTLTDYNFDGWHAADGWGPARLPLSECDYSDDMFEQFVEACTIEVPPHIVWHCHEKAQFEARADWIWSHHQREWTLFYTERWASFYRKKVAALHEIGKEVVINSAWTRDPFEAIYRYGIDYRKLIAAGVDGIVTESAAAASDMEAESTSGLRLDNFVAALLLIRAAVPDAKLVFLHGVKDVLEQWDVLRHAPTLLEKETLALANIYLQEENAALKRCADGFVVCLGDGIAPEEWRWLQARWDLSFGEVPQQLLGATLLWSNAALDAELNDYIVHRGATTHRLLYELTERGAPIQSAVHIENLQSARGALLVLNAHLLPENEREQVRNYRGGAVILIERNAENARLICRVVNDEKQTQILESRESAVFSGDKNAIEDPMTFLKNLEMQLVEEDFLKACAERIVKVSGAFEVASGEDCISAQAMEVGMGKVRVVLKNRRLAYCKPTIETGREIAQGEIRSEFPCAQLVPDGSRFSVKVPGRGAVVVDLQFVRGDFN